MKAVNKKSHKKPHKPGTWYRLRFIFPSIQACNENAMSVAALLRGLFPYVYFARYTGALESRLDVVVNAAGKTLFTQEDINAIMKKGGCSWSRIEGPEPCEGSRAHAAMFDFVMSFTALAHILSLDEQAKFDLWNDVVHWGHNMAGFDYIDESRCHLHSLTKIITVFEQSIKLGNRISAAQKRVVRRQRKPSLN